MDAYVKHTFLYDIVIVIVLGGLFYFFRESFLITDDPRDLDNIISNIISTIVSFSGFILASLTIIVTVKSNVASKPVTEANNPLEMLFSPDNYKLIVEVFRDAIIELVVCLLIIYVCWTPFFNFPPIGLCMLIILGSTIIFLSVVRSLAILFRIITIT